MQTPGKAASFWLDDFRPTHYPPLEAETEVDVAVVGAGIVGLTAALLLKQAGQRVAVIEARRCGHQVTGRSTAKVTSLHALIYDRLISKFGEDGARIFGESNEAAIGRIAGLVQELQIDCGFERKAAYTVSRTGAALEKVQREAEAARRLGLPATFVTECDLPFPIRGAVRFDNQAQFDPARYAAGLAASIPGEGCAVYEMTRVTDVEHGEPCVLHTSRGNIRAREVIIATNMPFIHEGLFYARAYPRAHPAMVARVAEGAAAPDGMYFMTDETPTHSVRPARQNGATYLVFTGGPYEAGQDDQLRDRVEDLQRYIGENFPGCTIEYTWTNEDYDSMDGVPFIGSPGSDSPHLYIATGFNAWGMTAGTVAGIILADLATGRENPWAGLYDARRVKPLAGGPAFVAGNVLVAKHYVAGWLAPSTVEQPEDLARGDSAVLKWRGDQVGAYRDESGTLHIVSAVCTHLGCPLGWNGVDKSWDCPCHGSRFSFRGEVLHGPATQDLKCYETDTRAVAQEGESRLGQGGADAGPGRPKGSKVDVASDQSFPASDPPAYNPIRTGAEDKQG